MLPIIIILVIVTVVAIGLYQLLIQKYYWGPKGPPKKDGRNKEINHEDTKTQGTRRGKRGRG